VDRSAKQSVKSEGFSRRRVSRRSKSDSPPIVIMRYSEEALAMVMSRGRHLMCCYHRQLDRKSEQYQHDLFSVRPLPAQHANFLHSVVLRPQSCLSLASVRL
jgi:hypothetical protein